MAKLVALLPCREFELQGATSWIREPGYAFDHEGTRMAVFDVYVGLEDVSDQTELRLEFRARDSGLVLFASTAAPAELFPGVAYVAGFSVEVFDLPYDGRYNLAMMVDGNEVGNCLVYIGRL